MSSVLGFRAAMMGRAIIMHTRQRMIPIIKQTISPEYTVLATVSLLP